MKKLEFQKSDIKNQLAKFAFQLKTKRATKIFAASFIVLLLVILPFVILARAATTYTENFQPSGLPSGISWNLQVDGQSYGPSSGAITVNLQQGGHTFTVQNPLSGGIGVQYITPNTQGSFYVPGVSTINIPFTTYYQLTTSVNPSNAGTTAPTIGTNWYSSGQQTAVIPYANPGFTFAQWVGSGIGSYTGSGDASPTGTGIITMNSPIYEIADFTASASTPTPSSTPTSAPLGIVYSVAITLNNAQPVPTPSAFQQLITINSATYSSYEASNLQNIEFYDNNGKAINSWLEQGNSNAATNTIYWLKLPSIPANSQITIYMGFASLTTNLFNSQTTGEAPQLSAQYGEYDNGATVFNNYFNFAGTSLPAGWTQQSSGAGSVSINNGLSVSTGGSSHSAGIAISDISTSSGMIIEGYVKSCTNGYNSQLMFMGASTSSASFLYLPNSISCQNGLQLEIENNNGGAPSVVATSSINPSAPFVLGVSGSSLFVNYVVGKTISGNIFGNGYLAVDANSGTSVPSITYDWIRLRASLPNSVMPTATITGQPSPVPSPTQLKPLLFDSPLNVQESAISKDNSYVYTLFTLNTHNTIPSYYYNYYTVSVTYDLFITPIQPVKLANFGPLNTPGTTLNQLLFAIAPISTGLLIEAAGIPVSPSELYAVYQALTGPSTTGNVIEIKNVADQTFLVTYSGCTGTLGLTISGTVKYTLTPLISSGDFTQYPPPYSGTIPTYTVYVP